MEKTAVPIMVEIKKEFRFEAAHFLPQVPKEHQCHRLHGHSYKVIIAVRGPIDEHMGWVMDLNELSIAFAPLLKVLDHSLLNEVEGLVNPTSENVALWIFRKLEKQMPGLSSVTLSSTGRISVTINRDQIY